MQTQTGIEGRRSATFAQGIGNASILALQEDVRRHSQWVAPLEQEIARVIVGQRYLVERLLVSLLSSGHVLLEGVPGLAKTLSVKTLAQSIDASFARLQFTPDLVPADIVGTRIYKASTEAFEIELGP
ncbi:MAG: AAA family ATPase, partial [Polyangiaceae bacterium]